MATNLINKFCSRVCTNECGCFKIAALALLIGASAIPMPNGANPDSDPGALYSYAGRPSTYSYTSQYGPYESYKHDYRSHYIDNYTKSRYNG